MTSVLSFSRGASRGATRLPGATRRFVCVKDVAAPYRLHLFGEIERQLAERGVASEFVFMARTVAEHAWQPDPARFQFNWRFAAGIHAVIRSVTFHWNLGLVLRLLAFPPDYLMIGGSWNQPTAAALLLAPRRKARLIFWAEANRDFMTRTRGAVMAARQAVLSRAAAFAVPGRIARETIEEVCGIAGRPFLPLPNVVDERFFRDRVQELRARRDAIRVRLGVAPDQRLLLWPARLEERYKGILNFLEATRPVWSSRCRILIAGDGSDRPRIEEWLSTAGNDSVTLLGDCSSEMMLDLLAAADVLMLPSLRDSNPLSIVEGLCAGLPILTSTHCGNWPETLEEERNGWLVDPHSPESMRTAYTRAMEATPETLETFGHRSRAIAEERFTTATAVARFVEGLLNPDDK